MSKEELQNYLNEIARLKDMNAALLKDCIENYSNTVRLEIEGQVKKCKEESDKVRKTEEFEERLGIFIKDSQELLNTLIDKLAIDLRERVQEIIVQIQNKKLRNKLLIKFNSQFQNVFKLKISE